MVLHACMKKEKEDRTKKMAMILRASYLECQLCREVG